MTSWVIWRVYSMMRCVVMHSSDRLYSYLRFGGGTEMLRDGDKDGMWRLLKQGLRCEPSVCEVLPFGLMLTIIHSELP